MLDIADQDIGGARVRRTFTRGDHRYKMGDMLTRDDVLNIAVANRRALSDSNFIEIYPRAAAAPLPNMQRFVIGTGDGRFNVIEGYKINEKPLSKDEAQKLARE